MSERLKELQRLRAQTQDQLAWFDREIAREHAAHPNVPAAPLVPITPGLASIPIAPASSSNPIVDADAEKILQRYQHAEHPVRDEVRRGCFLYFAAAFLLLALGLTALYFFRTRSGT